MKLEYSLKIYPDKQLIYEIVKGEITISELVELQKQKINHPMHDASYNILVDLRGVSITDFSKNYHKFPSFFIHSHKQLNTTRKCAVITSTPNEVVIAELLTYLSQKAANKINYIIFSSEETALNWLGVKM